MTPPHPPETASANTEEVLDTAAEEAEGGAAEDENQDDAPIHTTIRQAPPTRPAASQAPRRR